MSKDYFSIATEDVYYSKGKKDLIPELDNEQDIPCETCDNSDTCALMKLDCVASRSWYARGSYNSSDVKRLIRGFSKR